MDPTTSLRMHREKLLEQFKGKPYTALPTPSFVLDLDVVKRNSERMLSGLSRLDENVRFRPHVKTHKTGEIVRIQLGNGAKHTAVVASTLPEIRGLLPLVHDGVVTDILYGIPPAKSKLPELANIAREMFYHGAQLRLMLDSTAQVEYIAAVPSPAQKWSVFVKVDVGDNRAGRAAASSELADVVRALFAADTEKVELYGFYAHRGSSYGATGVAAVIEHLRTELEGVTTAAKLAFSILLKSSSALRSAPFVLSVGATPTAQTSALASDEVASLFMTARKEVQHMPTTFEIHAGNYAILDIQQVATGLVAPSDVAGAVVAEVLAYYADRQEYLVDAGVLALAREPGRIPGIATVKGQKISGPRWIIGRVSQEHGILSKRTDDVPGVIEDSEPEPATTWELGDKVLLLPQHVCITSSMFQWYFILENDLVVDVYIPWRGW
ncbi:putative serine dehydratase domain-containing protein [Limtongia smithiae]|uniref:putative serine dehydratase domain-containing protein n=1 Tax=Limtongia smithiae TaxID=1125753 RepID=UPI0034CE9DA4